MLLAKNDSERIKKEIGDLRSKNKPLLKLILDLYHYIEDTFDKDTIITMIYRTQEEQDNIYKDNEKYKQRKFKSPHQFYHGIDLRSRIYTQDEIDHIVDYLNDKYNDSNYYKFTAMCHNVGHGDHFHIQYYKK